MKTKNKIVVFCVVTFVALFCILGLSCVSSPMQPTIPSGGLSVGIIDDIQTNISFPLQGSANNVNISAEFVPVGIVFVNSEEVIDQLGNNTGSKITYEMFMREASRLQAHEVININIDVNIKRERQILHNKSVIITTYSYTGTGLAIRYSNAKIENVINSIHDLPDTMGLSDAIILPVITNIEANNNSGIPLFSNDAGFTVISVRGIVWRSTGRGTSARVRVNHVLKADDIISMNSGSSSLVLSDGTRNLTITGPKNGRIGDLISF